MSRRADFYRALGVLASRASAGDRQAELALDRLLVLFGNVRNAVEAGDQDQVDDLLTDAIARAYIRQALG